MSTRRRRPGDASAPLIFALVAFGCTTVWVVWLGVLMLSDSSGPQTADWVLTVAGGAVLVAVALLVASLLRGPTRIVAHDPSGARWSLRAAPVPVRLATSEPLEPGSRGAALAAQVVRAATRRHGARSDTTQAVMLLRQVLALAERSTDGASSSAEPVAEAEWRQVRAAVIDFALRASDHPPQPVSPTPPPQRAPAPW